MLQSTSMKQKYRYLDQAKKIIAQEEGVILKDWGGKLPVALVWPNSYYLGMSSLALHVLYRLLNDDPQTVGERVFFGYQQPPRADEPIMSLESQRPLQDFAALAFTVSYELDYFNIIEMLRRAEIPLFSADRDENWPLLIAGGPAIYTNPAPMADIFDVIAVGEAEEIVPPLLEALWEINGLPRPEAYQRLAEIPGLYIPSLTQPPVARVWARDLASQPTVTQIYSTQTEFGDRTLIEMARGCGRGCRYCLAGYGYRPMREIPLETILATARHGLHYRQRVGLVSAAVSDYSAIDELAMELRKMGLRLSAASMRVDPLSEPLIKGLAESGNQTLTIAPEAGSDRLRHIINKPQTESQILHAVELAARYNFPQLKMYFMIGQPSETEADIEAIANLTLAARQIFPRHITINATPYVPKAHTAFQWTAMATLEILEQRLKYLQERLSLGRLTVRSDSPSWAMMEGVLARGDRRLGRVLSQMKKLTLKEWQAALVANGLDQADFLREWSLTEPLPWQVVNLGVSQSFLQWEVRQTERAELTAPCPPSGCLKCQACDEAWAFRL